MRYCRFWAKTCTAGASALRSACRQTTRRSGNPLRRAISAKSARSAWIIPARVMRTEAASVAPSRVSTGKTMQTQVLERALAGFEQRDRRQRVEPGKEHEDQQRADHELRQRDDRERGSRDSDVGRPADVARRHDPEQQGQGNHEERGDAREPQRRHEARADLIPDRQLGAGRVARRRISEVAMGESAQPVAVLHDDGPVEAHRLPQLRHLRRCRGLSEDCAGGVARQHLSSGEDEHRHDEQRPERRSHAAHEKARDRMIPPGGTRRRNRAGLRQAPHASPRPRTRRRGSPTRRG